MEIHHDPIHQKFYTLVDNKEYSLEYNEVEPRLWEFHCSFFLNEITKIKETEIRDQLIEYALYYMARNNIKLLESGCCHQVREFLDRQRQLEFLVKK